MDEKRQQKRLKDVNEITVTVISEGENLPKKNKIFYNYSNDISVSGIKIQTNFLFPIDTLLKIDLILEPMYEKITALGKVKWIKVIMENEFYEAGVEFVETPGKVIKRIKDYISVLSSIEPAGKPFWLYTKTNDRKSK